MPTLIDRLSNFLNRKTETDHEIIRAAAFRSARGDETPNEKEIEAIGSALQRLNKGSEYMAGLVETIRKYDQAIGVEKQLDAKKAEVAKLTADYNAAESARAPYQKRAEEAGDKLNQATQEMHSLQRQCGRTAQMRAQNPELFADELQ